MTKSSPKRSAIFPFILSLILLVAMLAGCSPTVPKTEPTTIPTEPTTPTVETTALPDNTWSMQAALVNGKGEVLETMELNVKVMIWDQGDGHDCYSLNFSYPENIYNSATGVMPYPDDESAYTCSHGVATENGLEGEVTAPFYVGFDSEKECFIVDFDDGQDVYLIAYRSPNADLSALWTHFQDFIAMVPDDFPTVTS